MAAMAPTRVSEQQGIRTGERLDSCWVPLAAIFVLWLCVGGILLASLRTNAGHLVYALDDPYIHMAVAKNLVLHGVWGVTSNEFSSSTSSLLWPLLLAASYVVLGVNDWVPLALNIGFATLVLVVLDLLLRPYLLRPAARFLVLLLIGALIPLPLLVIMGMEHTLQVLLVLVVAGSAIQRLDCAKPSRRSTVALFVLVPLVTATRYEGCALLGLVVLAEVARRRWGTAALIFLVGLLPLAVFGAISLYNGSFALPNSVLLKSRPLGDVPVGDLPTQLLIDTVRLVLVPLLFALVVVAIVLAFHRARKVRTIRDTRLAVLAGFVLMTLAQTHFGQVGFFYRYETHLVALGSFAVVISLPRPRARNLTLLLLLVLTPPMAGRAIPSFPVTVQASHNIYEQQYQMARFLATYYPGQRVALNDIGAASFYADIHPLDVYGLGSLDVARLRLSGNYNPAEIGQLAVRKQVDLAMVYDRGFRTGWITTGGVPADWIRVERWTIHGNVVVYDATVSFYARDYDHATELVSQLTKFDSTLPADVIVQPDWPSQHADGQESMDS